MIINVLCIHSIEENNFQQRRSFSEEFHEMIKSEQINGYYLAAAFFIAFLLIII